MYEYAAQHMCTCTYASRRHHLSFMSPLHLHLPSPRVKVTEVDLGLDITLGRENSDYEYAMHRIDGLNCPDGVHLMTF